MRVLFVAMRWDYKERGRGDSFEYTNFWESLRRHPRVEARMFPFDEKESELGREGMNAALLEEVHEYSPELVFFFMFTDEFDPKIVRRISDQTVTVNWFADDQWRFDTYSRHWAPHLTWVATTDPEAAEGYRRLGFSNVIRTQWGCNHYLYRPLRTGRDIQVSFVGQPHGTRRATIDAIREAGVEARAWGYGWEDGRLSQTEMIEAFSRSCINLNLSNASRDQGLRRIAGLFLKRKGPLVVPRMGEIRRNLQEFRAKGRDQIKGRNFEIPGCRTFMLTSHVEGLDEYFVPGKEMVTFAGTDDLIAKIGKYLESVDEREAIAEAAYERTLAE
ncbi:MAG TPA: glycosyltransferase, partial [Actinomycetota bacterium]|nr:glycosyltransferase [Actinomycetota bacterium]